LKSAGDADSIGGPAGALKTTGWRSTGNSERSREPVCRHRGKARRRDAASLLDKKAILAGQSLLVMTEPQ